MRLPKIDRILAAEGELQPLVTKARELSALAGLVDGFFPPDLARQVRVANFREGELVLLAANSSAAAKLRLLAPSLSRFLSEQRREVNSVSVRVQPSRLRGAPKGPDAAPRKAARLSHAGLAALRELLQGMSESPARDALRLLIAHSERKGRT